MLTRMMYNAVPDALSKNFRIVDKAGSTVLRVRVALTEAQGAKVALNAVTAVIPQLRVLATLGGLAGDTAKLVDGASAAAELVDSVTGVRLAAAVDRETGTKGITRAFSKWAEVQDVGVLAGASSGRVCSASFMPTEAASSPIISPQDSGRKGGDQAARALALAITSRAASEVWYSSRSSSPRRPTGAMARSVYDRLAGSRRRRRRRRSMRQ